MILTLIAATVLAAPAANQEPLAEAPAAPRTICRQVGPMTAKVGSVPAQYRCTDHHTVKRSDAAIAASAATFTPAKSGKGDKIVH